jgi:hypothetical protein
MKKEKLRSIGEILKEAEKDKNKRCDITFLNEPNYKLMAEGAINLYQQADYKKN